MLESSSHFRDRSLVLEEVKFFRDWFGYSDAQIAEKLGYKDLKGFQQILKEPAKNRTL